MIVDIHTHPPQHRDLPPGIEPEYNDKWRPDRAVKVTTCTGRQVRRVRDCREPFRPAAGG